MSEFKYQYIPITPSLMRVALVQDGVVRQQMDVPIETWAYNINQHINLYYISIIIYKKIIKAFI